jgi:dienelactone hydrolase
VTRGRLLGLAAVVGAGVAAGVTLGFGDGSKGPLTGVWAGGYRLGGAPVPLRVRLSESGGRLDGTAEIGIQQKPARTPLAGGAVKGERVGVTLANGVRLVGRVRGEDIAGTAEAAGRRGPFELFELHAEPVRTLRAAVGAYRFPDGTVVSLFVRPFGHSLRLLDYSTGDMRQLAQTSADDFVGGPLLLSPWPVQVRIQLVRDGSGRVVGLRRNGRSAERIPFRTLPARFGDGAVTLVGKLVLPPGPGPFPAVVLVPGSVRATRNTDDLWGTFYAAHGFAVLSFDKRGVGESTGTYVWTPTEPNLRNLAADALAGVAWLKAQPSVDPARIGLSGGSQAGWIIAIAASQSSDVSWAAVQSGPAMSVNRQRAYAKLTDNGATVPPPTAAQIHAALAGVPDGGFDPKASLEALRIPVLWQLGGVDKRQYTPETVADLNAAAAQGGHDFTIEVYPAGAHSLRETRHGLISEELTATRFVPGLFDDLASWLTEHATAAEPGS